MRLWYSRLASTSASQMLMVAIGWQMYDLTGSAWDLGLVGLLQFLPALLLVLVAGHVVDHFNRARIVALCMVAQTGIALLLAVAAHRHWASRDLLLLTSVLLGTVKAFQMPAQQALTPLLVPAEVLPRALAFSSMGSQGAIVAGPALGGFIYVAGAQAVYGTCALLFACSGALVAGVNYGHVKVVARNMGFDTLLAGVRFVRQRPVVLGAISLDLFAVLLGGATALLPIFAKDILHTGPWGLGLLRASPAIGAFALSLLLARWPVTRHAGRVLLGAVAVYGLATIVFGLSSSFVVSMVALVVAGAGDMVSVVIRQSLVQLDTPNEMRGRVSAVNSVFIGASNQLGEFESGVTAAALGPVGSVVLGGIGTLLIAGLWFRLFPPLAQRDALVARRP
ncbi:MFS transporter [Rhizobacter sp. Root404]|uniref:MFS transporter n=1 Tax=Rhizobacter sp. Root404 TaxID=1736528 RepID=UPI0006FEB6EB|nr:MFS transporter [Rhizobacter sp. Root404]KQW35999.1 MFS transporter [Rhizobacter sp. Root404]